MKISIIGSGNLATHLSAALCINAHEILQVYSRTAANARQLAATLRCQWTDSLDAVTSEADVYIVSVKDDAMRSVVETLCKGRESSLFIHTAGSVPLSIFDGLAPHAGVLYPMQTFTKERAVDFREIPCFVEATDAASLAVVRSLAGSITERVVEAGSETRRILHLAAVFACNMSNHCYRLAERLLNEHGLDFSLYHPLIMETARKATQMSPRQAQTGPMVRYDVGVMQRQLSLLDDPLMRDLYRLMADSIHSDNGK